jgi:hypothetical protein
MTPAFDLPRLFQALAAVLDRVISMLNPNTRV